MLQGRPRVAYGGGGVPASQGHGSFPRPPSARLLRTAAPRERPRDCVSRTPYSGNSKPEGALRLRTARPSPGKLSVRGSRVPPSGPPQVSKEAQRLLRSLLLPSPVGVAKWPSWARPSLHLIHSRTDPLLPGPLTRPAGQGEIDTTTYSFTTFSTTAAIFPVPLPQAGRPGARSAPAPGPNGGPSFLVPLRRRRSRASDGAQASRLLGGGQRAEEPDAQAQRTRARAPSLSLEPRLFHLEEREEGEKFCSGPERRRGEVGENWQVQRWARWSACVLRPADL